MTHELKEKGIIVKIMKAGRSERKKLTKKYFDWIVNGFKLQEDKQS